MEKESTDKKYDKRLWELTPEERQKFRTELNVPNPRFNEGSLYKNAYKMIRKRHSCDFAGKLNILGSNFSIFGYANLGIFYVILIEKGIKITLLEYAFGRYKAFFEYNGERVLLIVIQKNFEKKPKYGAYLYWMTVITNNQEYEEIMREIDENNRPQTFRADELPF